MLKNMLGVTLREARGPLNDLHEKLASEHGALWLGELKKFLRGEHRATASNHEWREENGIIYFNIRSDGISGSDWIRRFESGKYRIAAEAKNILASRSFTASKRTTEIAVIKAERFVDEYITIDSVFSEGERLGWVKPHTDVALLIREKFTDKQIEAMGLWSILTMHEPIRLHKCFPTLIRTDQMNGEPWIRTSYSDSKRKLKKNFGFAFEVSQVGLGI